MSIERIFHCDRDECNHHVHAAASRPSVFLTITGDGRSLHFCGWDCVMKYAAEKPPPQIIPFHADSEAPDA